MLVFMFAIFSRFSKQFSEMELKKDRITQIEKHEDFMSLLNLKGFV